MARSAGVVEAFKQKAKALTVDGRHTRDGARVTISDVAAAIAPPPRQWLGKDGRDPLDNLTTTTLARLQVRPDGQRAEGLRVCHSSPGARAGLRCLLLSRQPMHGVDKDRRPALSTV